MRYWIINSVLVAVKPDIDLAVNLVMGLICVAGVALLVGWQVRNPGLISLAQCPIRRNRLPLFFPLFQLFVWVMAMVMLNEIIQKVLASRSESVRAIVSHTATTALNIGMALFFLLVIKFSFVRGFKGFGLRFQTVGKDSLWAGINLVAIFPVVLVMLWLTMLVGQWWAGSSFELQKHQSLMELDNLSSPAMRFLLVVSVVGFVPVFEELLFRGLIQSVLVGYLEKPWLAIGITSALFAGLHYQTHFFGIFALSCGFGYAYEKSGSIFRPIFMHIAFNSISVAGVLLFGIQ